MVIGDIDEEESDVTLAALVEFRGGAFVPTDVSSSSDCDQLVQKEVAVTNPGAVHNPGQHLHVNS